MSSRTQLRLQQLTGSFGDAIGQIHDHKGIIGAKDAIVASDLSGSLSYLAASIRRIHGAADFSNQVEGQFDTTKFDVNTAGAFTADAVGTSNLTTNGALTISGSLGLNLKADSGTLDIETRLGAIDVDAGTSLSLDGASGINIGTGTDVAIDINSSTLDIDASGAITIDTSGNNTIGIGLTNSNGNINIAADGTRTITIGEDGEDDKTLNVHASAADIVLDAGVNNVAITGGMTVSGNTVLSGDLTVLGAATEISSSNTTIKDALIVLNSSSFGNGVPIEQDAGIIFAQPDVSRALFVDTSETGDPFRFVTTYTSGTATSVTRLADANVTMGALTSTGATVSGLTDNQIVFPDANGLLEGHAGLTFDGSDLQLADGIGLVFSTDDAEKIESDGSDLNAISGGDIKLAPTNDVNLDSGRDILLDVAAAANRIDFKINGADHGFLMPSGSIAGGNSLLLSSSAGKGIHVDPNNGQFLLTKGGSTADGLAISLESANSVKLQSIQAGDNYLELDLGITELAAHQNLKMLGTKAIKFNTEQQLIKDAGGGALLVSASQGINLEAQHVQINNTATGTGNAGELRFLDKTGGEYAAFKAADTTTTYTLTLPATKGSLNGAVLRLLNAGDGTLEFADLGANTLKYVHVATASLPKAATLNLNTSDRFGESSAINNLSTFGGDGKMLDVFVNGQLLVSGSEADRAATLCDYKIADQDELQFAFDLEADDVVQVIKRG